MIRHDIAVTKNRYVHIKGLALLMGGLALLAISGCGNNSNFASAKKGSATSLDSPNDPTNTPNPVNPPNSTDPATQPQQSNDEVVAPQKYNSLTWYWQCNTNTKSSTGTPTSTSTDPVVIGAGEHDINPASLPEELPVIFNGDLCPAQSEQRDIIFVVDISGSMVYNDPLNTTTNTCGRYDAVNNILKTYASSGGNLQFSVITFSDSIGFNSTAFATTPSAVYASMGSSPASVICAAAGATYYDIAFNQARQLFQSAGRANATKEIYFISDGEPNTGHDGIVAANSLKTTGITIGTTTDKVTLAAIMLNGQNQVLQQLASVDSKGNPLAIAVANANQLAATLSTLASVTIVKAEVLYRTVGTTTWTTLNALNNISTANTNQFIFPAITIQTQDALQGIEAQYNYWNSNNQAFQSNGTLQWKTTN